MQSWTYDGVGNRTFENSTVAGTTTSDQCTYPAASNRIQSIVRNGTTTVRSFGYDGAGNITSDSRSGVPFTYTYNNANRLKTVSQSGNLLGTYTYNGFEQLIKRVITNSGTANGTIHTIHDIFGNVIAELDATGNTVREYIYLPEAEIAPTRGSRTTVDRPIAVVDGVNTTPVTLYVHVDHLHRPVRMTNAAKATQWDVIWTPWGAPHTITGAQTLNARFPGQWFQLEAGLHYNWHRHYDPSLGRYTQPDPLGFVDGPSVYAYAGNSPGGFVDISGQFKAPPTSQLPRIYPPPTVPQGPPLPPSQIEPYQPPLPAPPSGDTRDDDHKYYKRVCEDPAPSGLDACKKAAWDYQRRLACCMLRQEWDDKYWPGRHTQAIADCKRAAENARAKYLRLCHPDQFACQSDGSGGFSQSFPPLLSSYP